MARGSGLGGGGAGSRRSTPAATLRTAVIAAVGSYRGAQTATRACGSHRQMSRKTHSRKTSRIPACVEGLTPRGRTEARTYPCACTRARARAHTHTHTHKQGDGGQGALRGRRLRLPPRPPGAGAGAGPGRAGPGRAAGAELGGGGRDDRGPSGGRPPVGHVLDVGDMLVMRWTLGTY